MKKHDCASYGKQEHIRKGGFYHPAPILRDTLASIGYDIPLDEYIEKIADFDCLVTQS